MKPHWTTAVPDWESRIVNGESLLPCEPLYPESAQMALDIFDSLILVDVLGKPTMGEATRAWARDFVAAIFGAYDDQSKEQKIKEFMLLIAKKNAKSTLAAAIMMVALILNDRESAELVILAPTKEIAANSFNPIRDMIKADPELNEMFNISPHTKTITHLGTNATLKVIAAENDSVGGIKASFVLVDELWIFGKRPNADSMLMEATGGLASRDEGFVIYLTTHSDESPAGVMKEKLNYARGVRDGKIDDPQFLGLLYEYPQEYIDKKLYLNEDTWHITNPNLEVSKSKSFIYREMSKAKQSEERGSTQKFYAKHLNIEITLSLGTSKWSAIEYWETATASNSFTLEDLIEQSEVITAGVDGGGLDDLLGFAVIGRLPHVLYEHKTEDGIVIPVKPWLVWSHAWVHKKALDQRKSIAPRLQDFERDGDLTIIEKMGDDTYALAQIIKRLDNSGKLDRVGLDPLGLGTITDELDAVEMDGDKLIGISQGFKMSGYILTAERKISQKQLLHSNQPLLNWCMSNCMTVNKGSGTMISKAESGKGKIDPVIGLLNATALMSQNPEPPKPKAKEYRVRTISI